jgi:hypothetical protein
MINPFKEVNWRPGPAEKRKFAWSLVIGFPCVAIVLFLVRRITSGIWAVEPSLWLGGMGACLGLLLVAAPFLARPLYVVWYAVASCIGFVVSNVLVAAFYFLILTPVGLLLKASGRVPLSKEPNKRVMSYWRDAEQVTDAKRYFSQF